MVDCWIEKETKMQLASKVEFLFFPSHCSVSEEVEGDGNTKHVECAC